jgi:hypothetical protein
MNASHDSQIVDALPTTLKPSTCYYVHRAGGGGGFDVTITDASGVPVAMRLVLIKGDAGSQQIVDQANAAAREAEASKAEAVRLVARLTADQTAFEARANDQISALQQMAAAMRSTQAAADAALLRADRVLADHRAMLASGDGGRLLLAEPLVLSGGSDAPPPNPPVLAGPTLYDIQLASPFIAFGGNVP